MFKKLVEINCGVLHTVLQCYLQSQVQLLKFFRIYSRRKNNNYAMQYGAYKTKHTTNSQAMMSQNDIEYKLIYLIVKRFYKWARGVGGLLCANRATM